MTVIQIKSGGHTTNPGFSSTVGVHISLSRFSDVTYDPDTQTAAVGAGLTWDAVYAALEPYGVNVVGARGPGVGVGGLSLGGGPVHSPYNEHFTEINYRILVPHKPIWFDCRHCAGV